MDEDITGLELSRLFYEEAVGPILAANFPDLKYAAALIGYGSEVLGFDTPMSRDHAWGPRLLLFLREADDPLLVQGINESLRHNLPYTFRGYPTNWLENPTEPGVRIMQAIDSGPVNHFVWLTTVSSFFQDYLAINPYGEPSVLDWLTMPEQKLRAVTAGEVFFDNVGDLTLVRQKLAYYPPDVWRLLLAAQWTRLDQEAPFMGRCGDVGDELGSQVVAARLVRDIMRLCFLIERQYAPYIKWFGTAFARFKFAVELDPLLQAVIYSRNWQTRQEHLVKVYAIIAEMYNALSLTKPIEAIATEFYARPYLVLQPAQIIADLQASISDPAVRSVLTDDTKGPIGSLDQWADSTDILSNSHLCHKLQQFYNPTSFKPTATPQQTLKSSD